MFAAFTLGLRHGFDWDHIAAISDLTGTQARPRRSILIATMYVLGHALMVLALGTVAIVFGNQIPSSLDAAMGYLVGVTLVMLAVYLLWTITKTRTVPVASRWMLVIGFVRKGVQRVRYRDRVIVIEHADEHTHAHAPDGHFRGGLHDHEHDPSELRALAVPAADANVRVDTLTRHGHLHRHVVRMPEDPFVTAGPWTAAGVGVLHGIGAETPTQILIFAAAANASGRAGFVRDPGEFRRRPGVLEHGIALGMTFGFLGARGNRVVLIALSLVTAAVSLAVGLLLLTGRSDVLPAVFPG